MDDKEIILKNLIADAKNIVFFTGAGVSTESSIQDFRSKEGLYNCISEYGVPYEIMLSHDYYEENGEKFFDFYRKHMVNLKAEPNFFHYFVAELEKTKKVTVITQNIDGLHQKAGSQNVIELHGSIYRNFCENCGRSFGVDSIMTNEPIPHCPICGGRLKPDVVLYDEQLNEFAIVQSEIDLQNADILIVAGTSLKVYPAAGLINFFFGNNIVVINNEALAISSRAKFTINDSIAKVFQDIYKK